MPWALLSKAEASGISVRARWTAGSCSTSARSPARRSTQAVLTCFFSPRWMWSLFRFEFLRREPDALVEEIALELSENIGVRVPVGAEIGAMEAVLLSESLQGSLHLETLLKSVERQLGKFDVRCDSAAAVDPTAVICQTHFLFCGPIARTTRVGVVIRCRHVAVGPLNQPATGGCSSERWSKPRR